MTFRKKTKKIVTNFQFEKLQKFVELIDFYNQNFNLTGFSGDRLWKEGIYESIITMNFITKFVNKEKIKILDVGAGVGFPSIPFLIVNQKINLIICESMQKRCDFLALVAKKLDLKLKIICQRVEKLKNESYDLITARALANLTKLDTLIKNVVSSTSLVAFIKGPKVFEELKKCLNCSYKIVEMENDIDKKIYIAFKNIKS